MTPFGLSRRPSFAPLSTSIIFCQVSQASTSTHFYTHLYLTLENVYGVVDLQDLLLFDFHLSPAF